MIVVIDLLAVIAAAVAAVAGVADNRGSTQPLSDSLVISGTPPQDHRSARAP
jgi:hypothetical protein